MAIFRSFFREFSEFVAHVTDFLGSFLKIFFEILLIWRFTELKAESTEKSQLKSHFL